jgi:hypothetical protein
MIKPFRAPRGSKQCNIYEKKARLILHKCGNMDIFNTLHRSKLQMLFSRYIFSIEKYKQKKDYYNSEKCRQLREKHHYHEKLAKHSVLMESTIQMKIKCKNCEDIISSKRGGDFVSCTCFKNDTETGCYMDRERWFPERFRIGGNKNNYEVVKDESTNENI